MATPSLRSSNVIRDAAHFLVRCVAEDQSVYFSPASATSIPTTVSDVPYPQQPDNDYRGVVELAPQLLELNLQSNSGSKFTPGLADL